MKPAVNGYTFPLFRKRTKPLDPIGAYAVGFHPRILAEEAYLFVNRRRDHMKILHWDGGGFWIYYRVLEQGMFEIIESDDRRLVIDATQLAMLLGVASDI